MTNHSLLQLRLARAGRVDGPEGHWECTIENIPVLCLTDERADRMRLMAPVAVDGDLDAAALAALLEANFHSALDARLALHEGILWSLFVSPLSLLSEELAANGLKQVVTLARNAAQGEYRSGPWHFVG
jgi:hypothetical protein